MKPCVLEGVELGLFMLSASVVTVAVESEASVTLVSSALVRRAIIGFCMGATALALIRSSWGRHSGAHMNPAVTFTRLRLGRISRINAVGYVIGQCVGSYLGMWFAWLFLGNRLALPAVRYIVTVPGNAGGLGAFFGELLISGMLMAWALLAEHIRRLQPHSALGAAALICCFVTLEAPLSGMSMNPARTLGSALLAKTYDGFWIYFSAPQLGMLLVAECFAWFSRGCNPNVVLNQTPNEGTGQ